MKSALPLPILLLFYILFVGAQQLPTRINLLRTRCDGRFEFGDGLLDIRFAGYRRMMNAFVTAISDQSLCACNTTNHANETRFDFRKLVSRYVTAGPESYLRALDPSPEDTGPESYVNSWCACTLGVPISERFRFVLPDSCSLSSVANNGTCALKLPFKGIDAAIGIRMRQCETSPAWSLHVECIGDACAYIGAPCGEEIRVCEERGMVCSVDGNAEKNDWRLPDCTKYQYVKSTTGSGLDRVKIGGEPASTCVSNAPHSPDNLPKETSCVLYPPKSSKLKRSIYPDGFFYKEWDAPGLACTIYMCDKGAWKDQLEAVCSDGIRSTHPTFPLQPYNTFNYVDWENDEDEHPILLNDIEYESMGMNFYNSLVQRDFGAWQTNEMQCFSYADAVRVAANHWHKVIKRYDAKFEAAPFDDAPIGQCWPDITPLWPSNSVSTSMFLDSLFDVQCGSSSECDSEDNCDGDPMCDVCTLRCDGMEWTNALLLFGPNEGDGFGKVGGADRIMFDNDFGKTRQPDTSVFGDDGTVLLHVQCDGNVAVAPYNRVLATEIDAYTLLKYLHVFRNEVHKPATQCRPGAETMSDEQYHVHQFFSLENILYSSTSVLKSELPPPPFGDSERNNLTLFEDFVLEMPLSCNYERWRNDGVCSFNTTIVANPEWLNVPGETLGVVLTQCAGSVVPEVLVGCFTAECTSFFNTYPRPCADDSKCAGNAVGSCTERGTTKPPSWSAMLPIRADQCAWDSSLRPNIAPLSLVPGLDAALAQWPYISNQHADVDSCSSLSTEAEARQRFVQAVQADSVALTPEFDATKGTCYYTDAYDPHLEVVNTIVSPPVYSEPTMRSWPLSDEFRPLDGAQSLSLNRRPFAKEWLVPESIVADSRLPWTLATSAATTTLDPTGATSGTTADGSSSTSSTSSSDDTITTRSVDEQEDGRLLGLNTAAGALVLAAIVLVACLLVITVVALLLRRRSSQSRASADHGLGVVSGGGGSGSHNSRASQRDDHRTRRSGAMSGRSRHTSHRHLYDAAGVTAGKALSKNNSGRGAPAGAAKALSKTNSGRRRHNNAKAQEPLSVVPAHVPVGPSAPGNFYEAADSKLTVGAGTYASFAELGIAANHQQANGGDPIYSAPASSSQYSAPRVPESMQRESQYDRVEPQARPSQYDRVAPRASQYDRVEQSRASTYDVVGPVKPTNIYETMNTPMSSAMTYDTVPDKE